MAEKSYLVQKFSRITLGQISLVGYSVAGEETLVQVPELNVCFDIGRSPYFALTSDIVCITHAHMDHIALLARRGAAGDAVHAGGHVAGGCARSAA
jgi:ribonuclease BN (tRNA processing enzyme)